MKWLMTLILCGVLLASCVTYDVPEPVRPSDGLLVGGVGIRSTEESSIEREFVEITNVRSGEAQVVGLTPRGLLIVPGEAGERYRVTAVVVTVSAQVDAGTWYRVTRTPEGLVGVPEKAGRTASVSYRLRYQVENAPQIEVRPGVVTNLGRLEARLSGLFEAAFRGRTSQEGGLVFRDGAQAGSGEFVEMGRITLRPRDGHERVQILFARQFSDSAWLQADWQEWQERHEPED